MKSTKPSTKKSKKIDKKEQYKNVIPVFRVNPTYGTNEAKIKLKGTVFVGTKFGDEPMEFETDAISKDKFGDNILYIHNTNGYMIAGRLFYCNIIGSYLLQNDKFPVFYMSVMYEKKFVTGFMFSIYVYFKANKETMDLMTTPQKFLTSDLAGEYIIEVDADEDFLKKLHSYAKPVLEEKFMNDAATTYDENCSDAEMNRIIQHVMDKVDARLKEYDDILKPITLAKYPNKNVIINKYIKNICKNEVFLEMVEYGVKMRDDERRGDSNTNYSYSMPKRVFDFDELRHNPDKVDELLNNQDLDRSSDESDFD
jgi:hypothetical protein